jgi:multidrug efflux pump subunit AcrB
MNRAIAWFAENHVAANLLMAAILIGGLMTAPRIKQTIMPDFEFDYVSVTVVYPGASPEEIEKSVTVRIEEEIEDVEGIEELTSSANEGATKSWPRRSMKSRAGSTGSRPFQKRSRSRSSPRSRCEWA